MSNSVTNQTSLPPESQPQGVGTETPPVNTAPIQQNNGWLAWGKSKAQSLYSYVPSLETIYSYIPTDQALFPAARLLENVQPLTPLEQLPGGFFPQAQPAALPPPAPVNVVNPPPIPPSLVQPVLTIIGSEENNGSAAEPPSQGILTIVVNGLTAAKDKVVNGMAATKDKVVNVVSQASHAVSNAANTRVELYGYDVNPLHHVTRGGKQAYRYATGIAPPTSKMVKDDAASLGALLRTRVDNLPAVAISEAAPAPVNLQAVNPPTDIELEKNLVEIEEAERAKLLRNLSNFASFRFFHESIMGYTPEDSMKYYNKFINAADPNQAFYEQYGFFGGVLARILIPIVQWIIGLVFAANADNLSGISAVKHAASEYLQDPENVRKELTSFFSTTSDYFLKLETIHKEYAKGDGGTLTLDEYIKKRMDEDLEELGTPKDLLYKELNEWVVDTINIKTGIPVIGWLLDIIISAIMKPVLNKMNVVQQALDNGIGKVEPNPVFVAKIKTLAIKKLTEWTQKLKALKVISQALNRASEEGRVIDSRAANKASLLLTAEELAEIHGLGMTKSEEIEKLISISQGDTEGIDTLTPEEKDLLKETYMRILRYVPLEGVKEEDLDDALNPDNMLTWTERLGKKAGFDLDLEIAKNLEGPFYDLYKVIFSEFSQLGSRTALITEAWKSANGLFEENENARPPSADDLAALEAEAQSKLNVLMDTLLDLQFDDESSKKARAKEDKKVKALIQHTKMTLKTGVETLNAIQEQISQADVNANAQEIENNLHRYLLELNRLYSAAVKHVSDSEKLKHLEIAVDAKEQFNIEMQNLFVEIRKMVSVYDQSLEKMRLLKLSVQMQNDFAPVARIRLSQQLPQGNAGSGATAASIQEITSGLQRLSDLAQRLPTGEASELQPLIFDMRHETQAIDQNSRQLDKHTRTHQHIASLKTKLEEVHNTNSLMASRPDAAARTQLSNEIAGLKQAAQILARTPSSSADFIPKINLVHQKYEQIVDRLGQYPEIRNGELADYLAATETAIEALQTIKNQSLQPNTTAQMQTQLRESLASIENTAAVERYIASIPTQQRESDLSIHTLRAEITELLQAFKQHRQQESLPEYAFEDQIGLFSSANQAGVPRALPTLIPALEGALADLSNAIAGCNQYQSTHQQRYTEQLIQLNEKIAVQKASHLQNIQDLNLLFAESVQKIETIESSIHEPKKVKLDPAAQRLAKYEKKLVQERTERNQQKILKVATNPFHIQQLLLRGPLTRIMEERKHA